MAIQVIGGTALSFAQLTGAQALDHAAAISRAAHGVVLRGNGSATNAPGPTELAEMTAFLATSGQLGKQINIQA